MNGTRVWNRQFQVASTVFYKKEKTLVLQGMSHWGAKEFFASIQHKVDICEGMILKEDSGYLEPAELIDLDDLDFDLYCLHLNKKADKVREVMKTLLDLNYQWDILKYPGPPQTLCADVSWREDAAFHSYMHMTSQAHRSVDHAYDGEVSWDLFISSPAEARTLLSEVMYRFYLILDRHKSLDVKEEMLALFSEWSETYHFKNSRKAAELFHSLVYYFGSDLGEREPEHKAFVFDKRESRVLKLVAKIERLDYVPEILITYGA